MSAQKQTIQINDVPLVTSVLSSPSQAGSLPRSLSSFYVGPPEGSDHEDEKPSILKRNLTRTETTSLEHIRNVLGTGNESEVGGESVELEACTPGKSEDSPTHIKCRESNLIKSRESNLGRVSSASNLILPSEKKKFGMFGRKIEYATMDDVNLLNQTLREEIGRNRSRIGDLFEQFVGDMNSLHSVVDEVKEDHEQHRDSMIQATEKFTEYCIERLRNELQVTTKSLHESLESDFQIARQLLHELHHDIVPSLSARLDNELRATSANLSEQAALHDKQVTEQMASHSRDLDNVASKLRTDCATMRADCDMVAEQVHRGETLQKERIALQEVHLNDMEARVALRMEQFSESLLELAKKTDELHIETRSESDKLLVKLRESLNARVSAIENTLSNFDSDVALAAGVPTRRVEWLIKDVSRTFFCNDMTLAMPMRCLSPKFHAAGAHNLQLELELIHQDAGLGSCDVSLGLWGIEDLYLVFRLYIGEHSAHMKHTFDGRSLCESKHIVPLAEALNPAEDTLRVGIEVIEAISISTRDATSETAPVSTSFEGLFAPSSADFVENDARKVLNGLILEHHYVNHGTLDLVKEQVNLMQSRMTRRVEWKLEQASILSRCFSQGESLCSSTFEAAGIQGLQLVFYPSGYDGAKDGFCSFFLSCPSGSSLRCVLHAGKQRREARLESGQLGFVGRTNFCRIENCIESAGDYVLLVLEIEEAKQALASSQSHSITAMPASDSALEMSRSSPKDAVEHCESEGLLTTKEVPLQRAATSDPYTKGMPIDSIDSVLRLQRAPGKTALEDVKQLPSIWTPKPLVNVGDVLEGFYRFSDLKIRKAPGGVRRPTASAPYGSVEGSFDDEEYSRPLSSFCHSFTANSLSSRTDRERDRSSPRTERYRRMASNKFAAYAT